MLPGSTLYAGVQNSRQDSLTAGELRYLSMDIQSCNMCAVHVLEESLFIVNLFFGHLISLSLR
ncbi:hypothetical protein I7I48_11419 [Histoplasma ohiense]|nr:hypothetical protein I7I48_11419 [Histoplasma ohiense (nom. inval.)]